MKKDAFPSAIQKVTIGYYDSDVPKVNNRIKLEQNLFSFLLEGEKSVQYADAKITIDPSQFLLLSAGNCLMSEKTVAAGGRYRSVLIFFDNSTLVDFFIQHPLTLQPKNTTREENAIVVFKKDAFLTHFAESLVVMLSHDQPVSLKMMKVKLEELLLYISEHYPGQIQTLQNLSQREDTELLIRQAVSANIDSRTSVAELAFLCNMSLSTFKRRFVKIYQTSPNKWLIDKRMQKAANILKQGEQTASQIYLDLGYENLSSFVQSFKQVYGVTPKQYQLAN
ncbi:AraC family transcriptional regulator [Sphingobacteriaceae bacterium]|nr:AraC family transcriptional regulator [Sphingobacteriaceae bacterium]